MRALNERQRSFINWLNKLAYGDPLLVSAALRKSEDRTVDGLADYILQRRKALPEAVALRWQNDADLAWKRYLHHSKCSRGR